MPKSAEPFSLTNIPVPTRTPLGKPITRSFKYRVLGFNADMKLEDVVQKYAHRMSEVMQYEQDLQGRYTFIVRQVWDEGIANYTLMEK